MTKSEAEAQIRAILFRLEQDTGRVVDSISMRPLYVSSMYEETTLRQIDIILSARPGESWGEA